MRMFDLLTSGVIFAGDGSICFSCSFRRWRMRGRGMFRMAGRSFFRYAALY